MFKFRKNVDLSSCTLLVPSVSVGNVGQFAADLIISTLQMEKVATVWSPAIVPIIGGDPYDLNSESLMVSCELYVSIPKKIAVLQIRSPLVKKYAQEFLNNVVNMAKDKNISQIIVLSSSFASERHSINTVAFRYLRNEYVLNSDQFKSLQWIDYNLEQEECKIHGGGFAKKLLDISTHLKMPCIVLFKYCSEGDNIPDAVEMVDYLNNLIQFTSEDSKEYIHPPSWKLLYGNPPPPSIY